LAVVRCRGCRALPAGWSALMCPASLGTFRPVCTGASEAFRGPSGSSIRSRSAWIGRRGTATRYGKCWRESELTGVTVSVAPPAATRRRSLAAGRSSPTWIEGILDRLHDP